MWRRASSSRSFAKHLRPPDLRVPNQGRPGEAEERRVEDDREIGRDRLAILELHAGECAAFTDERFDLGTEVQVEGTWRDDRDFVLNHEHYTGASILVGAVTGGLSLGMTGLGPAT